MSYTVELVLTPAALGQSTNAAFFRLSIMAWRPAASSFAVRQIGSSFVNDMVDTLIKQVRKAAELRMCATWTNLEFTPGGQALFKVWDVQVNDQVSYSQQWTISSKSAGMATLNDG